MVKCVTISIRTGLRLARSWARFGPGPKSIRLGLGLIMEPIQLLDRARALLWSGSAQPFPPSFPSYINPRPLFPLLYKPLSPSPLLFSP